MANRVALARGEKSRASSKGRNATAYYVRVSELAILRLRHYGLWHMLWRLVLPGFDI